MRYVKTMAMTISAMISFAALANTGHSRHADAHVHGLGQLNFALEGNLVHLELAIPGFDILGFESINTDDQHQALNKAVEALKQADLWHFTAAAGCQLQNASVTTDENDHKHEHDHKHDHDDEHHHHDDKAHKSTHMDFSATYTYQCSNPRELKGISTRLFDRFKHSEKLNVQGITDAGQIARTITRKQPETTI